MSSRHVPAPPGDPFWDTLLRRHPDLGTVLLPEQSRRGATQSRDVGGMGTVVDVGDMVDVATLEAVRGALRVAVDAVLAQVGVDVGASAAELVERLAAGATRDSVSVHVCRLVPGGADEAAPHEVVDALREDRWDVSDHPGAVHRVVASRTGLPIGRGGLGIEVTVVVGLARTTGSLQIEAETVDLPVGEDVARALLETQRRESERAAPSPAEDA